MWEFSSLVKYHYYHQENDILQIKNVVHIVYWCDKEEEGDFDMVDLLLFSH